MPRDYFLTQTAINSLRAHKKWSSQHFGRTTTKKYFQDIDEGFQYIADNHKKFSAKVGLTGGSGLSVFLLREHYIVYIPLKEGIHVADILGRAQDILNILQEHAWLFRREISQFSPAKKHGGEGKSS